MINNVCKTCSYLEGITCTRPSCSYNKTATIKYEPVQYELVQKFELTDSCIERIAQEVVKLMKEE